MTRLRVRTASRLHFGLLGWGPGAARQFGGVGLMVEAPGTEVTCVRRPSWSYQGLLASRVQDLVTRVLQAGHGSEPAPSLTPAQIEVVSSASEHAGLGVGTQLSLAVIRGLFELSGLASPNPELMAELTGRGRRSGVGLHGFLHGGLIVDGGHADELRPPPLIVRSDFPEDWHILLVQPPGPRGRHGAEEVRSFAELVPLPDRVTERLCRLVLLGILPAVAERDLSAFGAALGELQHQVGKAFAPIQGGSFATPMSESLVNELGRLGLVGAGQSSWGPTLYAFGPSQADVQEHIRSRLREQFGLDPSAIRWTRAANHGAVVDVS